MRGIFLQKKRKVEEDEDENNDEDDNGGDVDSGDTVPITSDEDNTANVQGEQPDETRRKSKKNKRKKHGKKV